MTDTLEPINIPNYNHLPSIRPFDGSDVIFTTQYRRNLPHWDFNGSTYFITYCVKKCMGKALSNPEAAQIVEEALFFWHKERYQLEAYVIMPDHIHLILRPYPGFRLEKITQGVKGYTAKILNKMLNRTGAFWQDESWDHIIRDRDYLGEYWDYIGNNPVKAGLALKPEDYAFSSFSKEKRQKMDQKVASIKNYSTPQSGKSLGQKDKESTVRLV